MKHLKMFYVDCHPQVHEHEHLLFCHPQLLPLKRTAVGIHIFLMYLHEDSHHSQDITVRIELKVFEVSSIFILMAVSSVKNFDQFIQGKASG